jgi:hypothetical protein
MLVFGSHKRITRRAEANGFEIFMQIQLLGKRLQQRLIIIDK